ncbi:MAG TPA: hypothetical protein VK445_07735, partial [Dissulfurispiraceae bacterium]|nr:hypothetical protein [Dissulfurispiraceae bacterium]
SKIRIVDIRSIIPLAIAVSVKVELLFCPTLHFCHISPVLLSVTVVGIGYGVDVVFAVLACSRAGNFGIRAHRLVALRLASFGQAIGIRIDR